MTKLKTGTQVNISDLIRMFLASWLLAVTVEFCLLPEALRKMEGLEALGHMSLPRVICITGVGTALLWAISRFASAARVERMGMLGIFLVLSGVTLRAEFTWPFLGACILMTGIMAVYGFCGWNPTLEPVGESKGSRSAYLWITVGLTVLFFLFVSLWTVARIYTFSTPTFDFGIFAQMFYHMKESLLPMTTVERDGLLSHFRVHVSPVYYLLLPFYCLAPFPATLQVLQSAVIASAVIPLWKLCRRYGLTGSQRMLICAMLLLYPAFSGGAGYDIHENCFLAPLLLWLFYGIDTQSTALISACSFLTLMVKEDAAVYVAVIGLWLSVKTLLKWNRDKLKNLITGCVMLAGSLVWFFLVTAYLSQLGDGVMTYRYQNFMYDGSSSLITVVKSVALSPMKAVYECVDSEKLFFIGMTMLPILGLPVLTRRYERYILLIPYLLVNLMSDYRYQHDIFFQYTFGSTACLFYLTVVNLADWKNGWRRIVTLSAAVIISAACFGLTVVPQAVRYPVEYVQNEAHYRLLRDKLSLIPEDATVTASTFYTTFLSQREVLYDVRYSGVEHMLQTQYVVLDPSRASDYEKFADRGEDNGFENLVKLLEENGYQVCEQMEDTLLIFQKDHF